MAPPTSAKIPLYSASATRATVPARPASNPMGPRNIVPKRTKRTEITIAPKIPAASPTFIPPIIPSLNKNPAINPPISGPGKGKIDKISITTKPISAEGQNSIFSTIVLTSLLKAKKISNAM